MCPQAYIMRLYCRNCMKLQKILPVMILSTKGFIKTFFLPEKNNGMLFSETIVQKGNTLGATLDYRGVINLNKMTTFSLVIKFYHDFAQATYAFCKFLKPWRSEIQSFQTCQSSFPSRMIMSGTLRVNIKKGNNIINFSSWFFWI